MFDLLVIGGGPAGYAAAVRAAQLGGKVLIVEADKVGGTCLHRGCIPTKVLFEHAVLLEKYRKAVQNGFLQGEPGINLGAVSREQEEVISRLYKGLQYVLKTNGIEIIYGRAQVKRQGKVAVTCVDGQKEFDTQHILIATGSREARLAVPGAEFLEGAEESLSPPDKLCRVVIIGAGSTGLELASSYVSLGFDVTIIEKEKVILPVVHDDEISKMLAFLFKRRGIKVLTNTELLYVEKNDEELAAFLKTPSEERVVKADKIISSVGRKPNLEVLGNLINKFKTTPTGIVVNNRQETGVPDIYAAGDITGPPMLAHLSYFEGITAAENAMGKKSSLDRNAVPSCLVAEPGLAWVGMTERQARESAIPYRVGRFPFSANGRAVVKERTEGFVKVIVREDDEVVLGMQVLGEGSEELIMEGALAVRNGLKVSQVAETIHPHPSLGEAVWEACLSVEGRSIHG